MRAAVDQHQLRLVHVEQRLPMVAHLQEGLVVRTVRRVVNCWTAPCHGCRPLQRRGLSRGAHLQLLRLGLQHGRRLRGSAAAHTELVRPKISKRPAPESQEGHARASRHLWEGEGP